MRFMILVPASKESEAGQLPNAEMLTEMQKFNTELVKAGVMLAGDGLHASAKGARVTFQGGRKTVVDGPFTESKELISGFWIWQVRSREEAVEWLKRAPFGKGGAESVTVEIRQIFDAADFAPVDPTGEILRRDAEMRAELAKR